MSKKSFNPINIGVDKQLFIDDQIIESMSLGVHKISNQPVKHPDNPVIRLGSEWEQKGVLSHGGDAGSIFFDDERGIFRFYGWMANWDATDRFLFYAESKDGIRWNKPRLGQVDYLGYDTNFIKIPTHKNDKGELEGGNSSVFKDPVSNQQERYKMIFMDKRGGGIDWHLPNRHLHPENKENWDGQRQGRAIYPAFSSDGINFTRYEVEKPSVPFDSDTNNNVIWDAKRQRYLLYHRVWPNLDKRTNQSSTQPSGHHIRTAAWASSKDFIHWDGPQNKFYPEDQYICFLPDEFDRLGSRDFYTFEVLPYEDGFVGFTSVFHTYFNEIPAGMDSGNAQSPWLDKVDVQLLWSRDGEKFDRIGERRVFIPNGTEGSWDEDLIYTVQAPIVRKDLGEIWIYYEGVSGHHYFGHRGEHQRGQVGLAILRLDGFISITGSGTLNTKPLIFQGNQLSINATGVDKYAGEFYGSVEVEIIDAQTQHPIPGFTRDNCDIFGGDEISHTVSWNGSANVGNLQGTSVMLRFYLKRAKLFSFQFTDVNS